MATIFNIVFFCTRLLDQTDGFPDELLLNTLYLII